MNVVSVLGLATVLPESILGARWFAVLSTFVAINTILYVSMSIFKILPKPYLSDVVRRHGRRADIRSIYPDGHSVALLSAEHTAASSEVSAVRRVRRSLRLRVARRLSRRRGS